MIRLYGYVAILRIKSLLRVPAYWIPALLFPAMLFAMFGIGGSGPRADYVMASFTIYSVIGVAFFQFGVSIAQERETQWERYRRTLPGASGPMAAAQLPAALLFSLLAASLVIAVGFTLSSPSLGALAIGKLLLSSLVVSIPFT